MDKKLLLCCALFSVVTWSQTPKGFKSYPATDSWNFICENYALTGTAGIQIAKTEKGGIIKIFIETTNPTYIISGMLYLFLKDNTIITCVDRAWRETDGKTITSYYLFSAVEISKLKNTEILIKKYLHIFHSYLHSS